MHSLKKLLKQISKIKAAIWTPLKINSISSLAEIKHYNKIFKTKQTNNRQMKALKWIQINAIIFQPTFNIQIFHKW